jgi:hypothetical protein
MCVERAESASYAEIMAFAESNDFVVRRRPTINESPDAPAFLVISVPRSSRGTGTTRVERRPDAIIVGRRLITHDLEFGAILAATRNEKAQCRANTGRER